VVIVMGLVDFVGKFNSAWAKKEELEVILILVCEPI